MIHSLKLVQYKNHSSGEYHFSQGLNLVVGRNGIGKTNLLDAIYYMCMARSHSTPQDKDTVQFGKDFFRLESIAETRGEQHRIVIKVRPGSVKEISVDQKVCGKLSEYIGFMPVVMLAPEDIILIQGGSAPRRKFADLVGLQSVPGYLESLQKYQKLLSQRNALLRAEGQRADRDLLMTYSRSMVEPAMHISATRSALITDLSPIVTGYYEIISASGEKPTLEYKTQLADEDLLSLANRSLALDIHAGHTTKGVHRDDISFSLDKKPAKRFGSQGQVKSLLIALQLAQTELLRRATGVAPIVLLDDIFDRLDDNRSDKLTEIISRMEATQVFISDASTDRRRRLTDRSGMQAKIIELHHSSKQIMTDTGTLHLDDPEEE